VFLEYLGDEVIGLNTTLGNILSFLNHAELGIGCCQVTSLYKPRHDDQGTIINKFSFSHISISFCKGSINFLKEHHYYGIYSAFAALFVVSKSAARGFTQYMTPSLRRWLLNGNSERARKIWRLTNYHQVYIPPNFYNDSYGLLSFFLYLCIIKTKASVCSTSYPIKEEFPFIQ
jgi:hypothetical protein